MSLQGRPMFSSRVLSAIECERHDGYYREDRVEDRQSYQEALVGPLPELGGGEELVVGEDLRTVRWRARRLDYYVLVGSLKRKKNIEKIDSGKTKILHTMCGL